MANKITSINFEELLYVMDNDEVFISECFYDFMEIYEDFLDHIGGSIKNRETCMILKATEKFSKILSIISADRASALALSIRFLCFDGSMKSVEKVFEELCIECNRLRNLMDTYVCCIQKSDHEKILVKFECLEK